LVLVAFLLFAARGLVSPSRAGQETDDMTGAAANFLASLAPEQKDKAVFEFGADERLNWHFIPKPRKGLPVKEMTSAERVLAYGLLSSTLSHKGYLKAMTIMSLDQILKDMEQGKGPTRDPELYYFSIFGTPGQYPWGWRVEGHHLSVNFTLAASGDIAATPCFFGSNPDIVKDGPRKGLHILAEEEDLARALVKSMDDTQKAKTIGAAAAPSDIFTSNSRKVSPLEWSGITSADLSAAQREQLTALIKVYIGRNRPELAAKDWDKIEKAGLDKVRFAWLGGVESGDKHYYRVQGPTFLLEYDNTQNDANHVHAVWRDFDHDFGADVLRKHYEEEHSKP
jgi:hypothetical protein